MFPARTPAAGHWAQSSAVCRRAKWPSSGRRGRAPDRRTTSRRLRCADDGARHRHTKLLPRCACPRPSRPRPNPCARLGSLAADAPPLPNPPPARDRPAARPELAPAPDARASRPVRPPEPCSIRPGPARAARPRPTLHRRPGACPDPRDPVPPGAHSDRARRPIPRCGPGRPGRPRPRGNRDGPRRPLTTWRAHVRADRFPGESRRENAESREPWDR